MNPPNQIDQPLLKKQKQEENPVLSTWDGNAPVDYTVNPKLYVIGYKEKFQPYNSEKPRAIPFPSGHFGNDQFVNVSEDGNSVTFNFQHGLYFLNFYFLLNII